MEGKYYVYIHMLNDEVIYVGKGSGTRRYFLRRNKLWQEIVGENKSKIKVEIVKRFNNEEDAYEYERELTSYYKNLGQCRANVNIGKHHAESVKRKISEKSRGCKNSMYCKSFSIRHKENLSESRKGKRNHLYGKTGAEHNCSKPIVAIFPNGNRIEASSKNVLSKIMEVEYNLSPSMINRLIASGEPLEARYKKHEKIRGIIIQYIYS